VWSNETEIPRLIAECGFAALPELRFPGAHAAFRSSRKRDPTRNDTKSDRAFTHALTAAVPGDRLRAQQEITSPKRKSAAGHKPLRTGTDCHCGPDQPITGRGPGRGPRLIFGENYAFGVITETDRPKWAMVRRVREANLKAAPWRLKAGQK